MAISTPVFRYVQILFVAALLLPLCSASPVDDTALRYLAANETASASVANFTSGGITYYMVFYNQTEAFLLKPDGLGFSIVSDNSALIGPIKDYIPFKYGASVAPGRVSLIKNETLKLSNASRNCTTPMRDLLLNSPLMTIIMNNDYTGNTYRAVIRLTGQNNSRRINISGISNAEMLQNESHLNKMVLRGYLAVIVGGMNYLAEMSANLSENGSVSDNTAIMVRMNTLVTEFKTPLGVYVTDHNFMNANYPPVIKKCNFSAASFSSLSSLLSITALPSDTELADNLSKSAEARIAMAAERDGINQIVLSERLRLTQINATANSVQQSLVQYGLPTADFDSLQSDLYASLSRTQNSLTQAEAEVFDKNFNTSFEAFSNFTDVFVLSSTISNLAAADDALNQSKLSIDNAGSRMGKGNPDVGNLSISWETVRIDLVTAKLNLSHGNAPAMLQIINSTQQLTTIKAKADNINPVTAQLDVLVMGGVAILLIIVILAYFFIKNRKKQPPVIIPMGPGTPGLKKTSSSIIVERK
jgi:hypothetical protein